MFPNFTVDHVNNCSFSSWYPLFSQVTLKSHIIRPLPEDFIDYLNADGIVLPKSNQDERVHGNYDIDSDTDAGSDSDSQTSSSSSSSSEQAAPSFPALDKEITAAISSLGGAVFPKLNWSSPKDATWIAFGNTLKCTTPNSIYILLKSSDFISHDLSYAYEGCHKTPSTPSTSSVELPSRPDSFELVLRKWYQLAPSNEFRCFVRYHTLLGISQRDTSNFYSFLIKDRDVIQAAILQFFEAKILHRFPDDTYTFDVYVDTKTFKVHLLDFNPFGPTTDALLYDWSELLSIDTQQQPQSQAIAAAMQLRLVESQAEAKNAGASSYHNGVPRETFDFSDGLSISEFAQKFNEEILRSQQDRLMDSSEQ